MGVLHRKTAHWIDAKLKYVNKIRVNLESDCLRVLRMERHGTFHVRGIIPDFGRVIVALLCCAQSPSVLARVCRDNVRCPSECPAFGDRFDQRKAAEDVVSTESSLTMHERGEGQTKRALKSWPRCLNLVW